VADPQTVPALPYPAFIALADQLKESCHDA
jgi:hypothetical protein